MSDNDYQEEQPDENQQEEQQEYQQEEEQQEEEQQEYQQEEEEQEEQQQEYQEPEQKEPEPEPEEEQTYTTTEAPTDLDLDSAWDAICKDEPKINWYCAKVNKKQNLDFDRAGTGGLKELNEHLSQQASTIYLALLRVNSNDKGGSKRAKFVFIRFVGSKVPVMQKAKLTPNIGRLSESFPVKHLTFDLNEEMQGFDQKGLAKEFLRVGGAHKPNSYEFGPGQIHKV